MQATWLSAQQRCPRVEWRFLVGPCPKREFLIPQTACVIRTAAACLFITWYQLLVVSIAYVCLQLLRRAVVQVRHQYGNLG